ncbi:hypothetical protein VTH82DRAFT_1520 [Thermothelomyces myriococcoides]
MSEPRRAYPDINDENALMSARFEVTRQQAEPVSWDGTDCRLPELNPPSSYGVSRGQYGELDETGWLASWKAWANNRPPRWQQ